MNYPTRPLDPARRSIVAPLALAAAGLVLVIAIIVSVIPLSRTGSGGPGPNFDAQRTTDEIAFAMAVQPGLKYTGSFTSGGPALDSSADPGIERTWKFSDLIVTSPGNAEGTIYYGGQRAQYRVLANRTFVNAPIAFWKAALRKSPADLDWTVVDNKWVMAKGSGIPNLGAVLSPLNLGLRLVTPNVGATSVPGPQVIESEPKLPDTRYWPTHVPRVELTDTAFTVDGLTTTFDPGSRRVTEVVGLYQNYTERARLDLAVEYPSDEAVKKVFTGGRALVPELLAVPVIAAEPTALRASQVGDCAAAGCIYDIAVSGTVSNPSTVIEGYVNHGVKVAFTHGDQQLTNDCARVVRVPVNQTARYRCTVRGAPPRASAIVASFAGSQNATFATYSADLLTGNVDTNQGATALAGTPVRTGGKLPGTAEKYNFQVTAQASTIGFRAGDYTFDGYSPSGKFYVARSAGYADHVVDDRFDRSWPGYATLVAQGKAQVAAATGTPILWYVAETDAVNAFRTMLAVEGLSAITVYDEPAT